MQDIKIEYSKIVKKLLNLLSGYDNYDKERNRGKNIRRRWKKNAGNLKCWLCDDAEPLIPIRVAHIRSLEENGNSNEENLLPLCETIQISKINKQNLQLKVKSAFSCFDIILKNSNDSIKLGCATSKEQIRFGCHQLLDHGLIAKNVFLFGIEADILQKLYRHMALDHHIKVLEGEFGVRGKTSKIDNQRKTVNNEKNEIKKFSENRKLVSLLRRSGYDQVKEALDLCKQMEKELNSSSNITKAEQAIFYYEVALALQIGEKQKLLEKTIKYLDKSCKCAEKNSGNWGISQLELLHSKIFVEKPDKLKIVAKKYLRMQQKAIDIIQRDPKLKQQLKSRWMMNYLLHHAQLLAKIAQTNQKVDLEGVRKAIDNAWKFRNKLTVVNGWALFQSVHLVTLEAILLTIEGKYNAALSCLSRALRSMRGGRGKRPEGIKDIAYCMQKCFQKIGKNHKAKQTNTIAQEIFDQRSGVFLV